MGYNFDFNKNKQKIFYAQVFYTLFYDLKTAKILLGKLWFFFFNKKNFVQI